MTRVGAFEAKTHLSALFLKVEQGESIEITKRGVPVAILAPIGSAPNKNPREAAEIIRNLAKGNKLNGLKIRDLIDEGRRY